MRKLIVAAHNHNLDWSDDERFAKLNKMYLDAGIFYVRRSMKSCRSVNVSQSVRCWSKTYSY